jgi:hypothetical protein
MVKSWASVGLLEATRALDMVTVDTKSFDEEVRLATYRDALRSKFPEITADSLRIFVEDRNGPIGSFVRLQPYYRGFPVVNSLVVLAIDRQDKAAYATAHYYMGVDLGDETYIHMDSLALVGFVRTHWLEASDDSFVHAVPCIVPLTDESGIITPLYAIGANSAYRYPSRYLNWATGDTLMLLYPVSHQVSIPVHVWTKARVPTDSPVEFTDSPNIGVSATYNQLGPIEVCDDPMNGYCTIDAGYSAWRLIFDARVHSSEFNWLRVFYDNDPGDCQYCVAWGSPYSRTYGWYAPGSPSTITVDIDNWDRSQWDDPVALYNANTAFQWYAQFFPEVDQPGCDIITSWDSRIAAEVSKWSWSQPMRCAMWFGWNNNEHFWAQYRDVLFHEYGHVWQTRWYDWNHWGSLQNPCAEWANLQEGCAQFVAACLANDDGHTISPGGNLDNSQFDQATYRYGNRLNLPCVYPHNRGYIMTGGLWDMRDNIEAYGILPQGFTSATDWAHYLVAGSTSTMPLTFASMAEQILLLDELAAHDPNGFDLTDGTPNGQAIYDALIVKREIPDPTDLFHFYRCPPTPQTLTSTTVNALEPSGSINLCRGNFGMYSVYDGGEGIKFAWSMDEGTTWRQSTLAWSPNDRHPCISVFKNSNIDEVHITWDEFNLRTGGLSYLQRVLLTFSSSSNCAPPALRLNEYVPSSNAYDGAKAPVYITQGATRLLFAGRSYDWVPTDNGLWYRQYSPSDMNQIMETNRVPGSVNQHVTSLAACYSSHAPMEQNPCMVCVVWIADNNVYCRIGGQHFYQMPPNWQSTLHLVATGQEEKSNVTVAYSPDLRRLFVAWEETSGTPAQSCIVTRAAYWGAFGEEPAGWTIPHYITPARCQDFHSPSVSPFWDGYTPVNHLPCGLAFESKYNFESHSSVKFCPYDARNIQQQHWDSPLYVGQGQSVSLTNATEENGYALLAMRGTENPPAYDIVHYDVRNVYSPAAPTTSDLYSFSKVSRH